MNTDTPETDTNEIDTYLKTGQMAAQKVVSSQIARRLERERNQARLERDELIKLIQEVSNAAGNSGFPLLKMYMDEKMQSILEKLKEPKSEGV